MRTNEATATTTAAAQVTPEAPVKSIRDLVEWAIDVYGIEITKHGFMKKITPWLEAAEREGKGK